jgi:hypothetical protein
MEETVDGAWGRCHFTGGYCDEAVLILMSLFGSDGFCWLGSLGGSLLS